MEFVGGLGCFRMKDCRFLLFIIFFCSFLLLAYVSLVVFMDYPFCMDEYGYWYQADMLTHGKPYVESPIEKKPLSESRSQSAL